MSDFEALSRPDDSLLPLSPPIGPSPVQMPREAAAAAAPQLEREPTEQGGESEDADADARPAARRRRGGRGSGNKARSVESEGEDIGAGTADGRDGSGDGDDVVAEDPGSQSGVAPQRRARSAKPRVPRVSDAEGDNAEQSENATPVRPRRRATVSAAQSIADGLDQDGDPINDASEREGVVVEGRAPIAVPSRPQPVAAQRSGRRRPIDPELPDPPMEGIPRNDAPAWGNSSPRPRVGDSMPAPDPRQTAAAAPAPNNDATDDGEGGDRKRRRRGGRGRGAGGPKVEPSSTRPVQQLLVDDDPIELDESTLQGRRGKERKGRPVGRYLMAVHVTPRATHIAVLEGRHLVEHYVSIPADASTQIHGNIYLGRVQNVLPGMEAAFVDIGTPKNAVLYRGDVAYDKGDVEVKGGAAGHSQLRIEQVLKARQQILCQVTKNPIAHKGARLTQEVSLPGRFVVLVPNSSTYGISKRLPDNERKRLRAILDKVKPTGHGIIVRTAAEKVTEEELQRDVLRLTQQWEAIDRLAKRSAGPTLLYEEPDMAVRVIREEFNANYREIVIDDPTLFAQVGDYVRSISPALADRVQLHDAASEPLPLFERFHVQEQLLRATDRKVWLPSGGSLIIEHTEALTVIDVNTGKNVGTRNLEDTVFHNNIEAAEEIARQLRLRDIGGIIVIDFVDMEARDNRDQVIRTFREALNRDKTRTQVFEISELGLVEMTRKRIGEGLLESVTVLCDCCDGRGVRLDPDLVGEHAL